MPLYIINVHLQQNFNGPMIFHYTKMHNLFSQSPTLTFKLLPFYLFICNYKP